MDQPPDVQAFNRQVWAIVKQVPKGIVTTYGQIASMIPPPPDVAPEDYAKLSPRWVGKAMNAVSGLSGGMENQNIPWWRVINSKGGISMPEGSKFAVRQRERLEREGHTFDAKDQVDLQQVGWDGPDDAWRNERGLLPPKSFQPPEPPDDNPEQLSLF